MGQVLAVLVPLVIHVIDKLFQRPANPPPPPPEVHHISKEQMIENARREYGMDVVNDYNFGVSGPSGVGKSTFINALRGLPDVRPPEQPGEDVSAAVGIVETTGKAKRYRWPNNQYPHIALWDLPGGGTQSHPSHTYFHDKHLYAFDCLLLLTSTRFGALEAVIASQARTFNTPVVLVISLGDVMVTNAQRLKRTELGRALTAEEKAQSQSDAIAELKRKAREELARGSGADNNLANIPMYVISAQNWGDLMRGIPLNDLEGPVLETAQLVEHVVQVAVARRAR